jgi:hypothetical protein
MENPNPLGTVRSWARDFALLGTLSGCLAPLSAVVVVGIGAHHLSLALREFPWTYYVVAAVIAGVSGAAVGPIIRSLLRRGSSWTLGRWFALLPLVGAMWGALVGLLTALATLESRMDIQMSALCAALAAAVQVGWYWYAYLARRVASQSVWTLLLRAALVSVITAPAVVYGFTWVVG